MDLDEKTGRFSDLISMSGCSLVHTVGSWRDMQELNHSNVLHLVETGLN